MTDKPVGGATHSIEFVASGRGKAGCAPNPEFPDGIAVDVSNGVPATCIVALPYPAPECGHFVVQCRFCKFRVALTAAGRPDDPTSITIPCQMTDSKEA
jgi:hypothetical protein